jgi:hypothetical protein
VFDTLLPSLGQQATLDPEQRIIKAVIKYTCQVVEIIDPGNELSARCDKSVVEI